MYLRVHHSCEHFRFRLTSLGLSKNTPRYLDLHRFSDGLQTIYTDQAMVYDVNHLHRASDGLHVNFT